ncbi:bifunctional 2-polyprenyl-6-hydroxyphenol methylase/3-demethylubiquinol 3-O-methyltransferase UbiG [Herbaspirillum sp. RV1423]|uniref:class I SAM-dependent methyltransferase n=1 Tax=Herbaspirillum sp. RV1423 TaxID=1443993 RepID=UPI0004B999DF|nr:class I SAM-dependent methyltransferase [Herbaspirillum sp. RV1423]
MPLPKEDLDSIAGGTLAHYEGRAADFREGTRDHDVSQNINALLDAIARPAPLAILDFGCGPGRDLKTFSKLGHRAIGLDGTASFVEMARADSGCEVWYQNFFELDLPPSFFDGVFANASLFHVPVAELPRVLGQLYASLKADGVLFCSNPRGSNSEGWSGGRYGAYHDLEAWRGFMAAAGFAEIRHYYRPDGLLRAEQAWLATVWRKPSNER